MMLKTTALTKKFLTIRGPVTAIEEVNLEIEEGEFYVLVGPSGCGKSTLLNLIAGLEKPTRGEVWFNETLVASPERKVFVPTRDRNVAMVFQSYALYPHLNVFDNIAFPLRVKKAAEKEIHGSVGSVTSMLEISHLLKAKPGELSGGERQRVAIARAIVRKPDIFLLDEPLSNLDAKLRMTTRTELKKLQRTIGITTVYVTHDQVEAITLGDRIAVIKDGMIQQVGTPEDLYEKPVNPFVATFIGSPPMNLVKISLIREEEEYYLIMGEKKVKAPLFKKERETAKKTGRYLFGIRPEHIEIIPKDSPSSLTFCAKVTAVESLGREKLIHLEMGGNKLSVITGESVPHVGELIDIAMEPEKIHLFPSDG